MHHKIARAYILVNSVMFFSTGWFFATYVLFLLGEGMSLAQLSIINGTWLCVSFIANAPTGHMADRWGRKKTYVFGQIFFLIGVAAYALAHEINGFMIAEVLSGIGSASMSGSLDAWMRSNTNDETAKKCFANAGIYPQLAMIPSACLGGFVGEWFGYRSVWYVTCVSLLFTILLTMFILRNLPEYVEQRRRTNGSKIRSMLHRFSTVNSLRMSLFAALMMSLTLSPLNMYWTPILKSVGGESGWFGTLWIGIALLAALGASIVKRDFIKTSAKGIAFTLILMFIAIAAASRSDALWLVLAGFLLHQFPRGMFKPLINAYSNQGMEDESRATAISIIAATQTLGSAIGLLIFGVLTNYTTPKDTWSISAIMILLTGIVLWRKGE